MTKYLMVIVSLIVLTACSKNENSSDVNSTSTLSTATEASTTFSTSGTKSNSEQTSTSTSTENTEQDFPYAVNLNDFVQKITPNGNEEAQKMYYKLRFATAQGTDYPDIVVNVKELNNFGKSVYISTTEDSQQIYYPVTISSVPTKTITVMGNSEDSRKVEVNTQIKIEMPEDQSDPLQIVGDTYYLFYNQQDTISLAARNFVKNPGSEGLNNNNMVEYIQQVDTENTAETESKESTDDQYYNSIKEAWVKQKYYVDSIEDPEIKQATQTPFSAANAEATKLEQDNPEDTELIKESLKKVLDGK